MSNKKKKIYIYLSFKYSTHITIYSAGKLEVKNNFR